METGQFENLMRLIKLVGGKFIIVEDGEPRAVLMSYDEFVELASPMAASRLMEKIAGMKPVEQVNREIIHAQVQDMREEVIVDPAPVTLGEAGEPEIKIEPLDPF